jgi:adenine-specific DNA-methyltransferase
MSQTNVAAQLLPWLDRVTHGDCIAVLAELPTACVDLVVTDPPYLVGYRERNGRRVGNDDNDAWLMPAFRAVARVMKPDSLCASFYGWPHADRFLSVWKACGLRPVSHLVWLKGYTSRAGYTYGRHEAGYLLAKGRPPLPENPPPDVLPWSNTGNRHHPTEKPVAALLPLIRAFSRPGDIVLDPFAGSGSTGLAARSCGRRFILIEKEVRHCENVRRRIEFRQ